MANRNNIRWGIGIVWIAIFLPLAFMLGGVDVGRHLHGQSGLTAFPKLHELSLTNIRSLQIQSKVERALEGHIGLRKVLVRAYNELDYRLFRTINAPGLVWDKEGGLMEKDYLDEVSGWHGIGEELWTGQLDRLQALKDTLQNRMGVKLILILPPSKARVRPELMPLAPDFYGRGNYQKLISGLEARGMDFLDLNPVFKHWQDTIRFPLFPMYGGHWSEYGCVLATDTLISYLARCTGMTKPQFQIHSLAIAPPSDVDYDLGTILNLHSKLPSKPMAYPWFDVSYTKEWKASDWLIIGDSHFEQILFKGFFANLEGGDPEFWLYDRIRVVDKKYPGEVDSAIRLEKLSQIKYLVLVVSERFYHSMFWGLDKKMQPILNYGMPLSPEQNVIIDILNDKDWFERVVRESKKQGRSTSRGLMLEAQEWLYGDK